ncbi:MAG: fumarylacetoacetate hydrolase family protein [Deltaproteobacteria bacterium]|nr:fumarylacetoacetate hydrolase family protein [Deltaproteobacteria bacterium]
MPLAIALPAAPTLPCDAVALVFPVGRIWCVGRNYAAHTREMGADPARDPPFFFAKPATALVAAPAGAGVSVAYPRATRNLHHEVELVVAIGERGTTHGDDPCRWIAGLGVGLDLTRRDLQAGLKEKGLPWEMAKAFDGSAVVGALALTNGRMPPPEATIDLWVNDQPRQHGTLAEMIWPVADLLRHLQALVDVLPGDLVFTGTPAGVGPLVPGDRVRGVVQGLPPVEFVVGGG